MITLITEKPSVGMEFARLTGCRNRGDGYMDGGRIKGEPCCVTWAIGHLCQIDEDAATKALHWRAENLPVLPPAFSLSPGRGKDGKPDPGYVKQLKVIEKLFAKTDTIVNCGDAGREGELIQRYIYDYVCSRNPSCRKTVKRLWISSMTDEAMRAGLDNLMPSTDFDNLYLAGKARNEADWLVGINATEALTLAVRRRNAAERRVFSLGRVQTPTLALVCSRYMENKAFKPETFWRVKLHTEKAGTAFAVCSETRFKTRLDADELADRCRQGSLLVKSVEHKPKTIFPPLLHDQTSLQQEASKRYDMSPDETLATVQKLYEMKLVTYPRTGSQFIPHDVLKTIQERLRTLAQTLSDTRLKAAATILAATPVSSYNRRSVNDGKVTDHHALLTEKTAPPDLSGHELKIYNLIAERMLEAFGAPCECDVLSVRLTSGGESFPVSSTKILKPGWKTVRGTEPDSAEKKEEEETDTVTSLPELKQGEALPILKTDIQEGQTKPKPLYTYDSLLNAMKTAGHDSDDDDIKSAMKDVGLGTSATRAGILKILLDIRKFIKKEGKKIVPTETGLEIYKLVKDMAIANVDMTGRWEIALSMIADGTMDADGFDRKIRAFTTQITQQILASTVGDGFEKAAQAENITCPLCGSTVKLWDTNARCTNRECGLSMNRTVFGKTLGQKTVKHFLEQGKTGVVRGFVSKSGKSFDARLKRVITEKDGRKYANAEPVFDDVKPKTKKPFNK